MAVSINSITITQVNGVTPANAINVQVDSASEIIACPEGLNDQNGVTFSIEASGTQAELNTLNTIYYRVYTRFIWHIGMSETQLAGSLTSSSVDFTITQPSKGNYKAIGVLTLFFPEKLSGSRIAICFGLTEAEAAIEIKPGINRTDHERVKYLNIISSVENAPLIHDVHWSTIEAIVFGEETAERSDICLNENAFLHIHTRGLFGKRVTVKLYGQNSAEEHNTEDETEDNQRILLKTRDYTIKDNVLCIAFPMNDASRIFHPKGQAATEELRLEAKVIIVGVVDEVRSVISSSIILSGDEAEEPTEANIGTTKYVIGDPENRPTEAEEVPLDQLPEELNIHVGTLTFLSGEGTESTNSIVASVTGSNITTDTGSRYFTYPMTTYELKLQDFMNAGVVRKEEVITSSTDKEGNRTEIFNSTNIYSVQYNTTTINGFTETFYRTVHSRISTNGGQANVDYAKVRKLKEAAIANGRTIIDQRSMCRSGWQLKTTKNGVIIPLNRHKGFSFRYSKNHECPPGAFFLIPPYGGVFLLYAGDSPTSAGITHWTTTTRVNDNTAREQIKMPNATYKDYQNSSRDGIAFHRGKCVAACGCITLDTPWGDTNKAIEQEMFNHIFSGNNGEFQEMITYNSKKDRPKKGSAVLKLHLIMIEERDGDHRGDVSANNFHPKNRYKGE